MDDIETDAQLSTGGQIQMSHDLFQIALKEAITSTSLVPDGVTRLEFHGRDKNVLQEASDASTRRRCETSGRGFYGALFQSNSFC